MRGLSPAPPFQIDPSRAVFHNVLPRRTRCRTLSNPSFRQNSFRNSSLDHLCFYNVSALYAGKLVVINKKERKRERERKKGREVCSSGWHLGCGYSRLVVYDRRTFGQSFNVRVSTYDLSNFATQCDKHVPKFR